MTGFESRSLTNDYVWHFLQLELHKAGCKQNYLTITQSSLAAAITQSTLAADNKNAPLFFCSAIRGQIVMKTPNPWTILLLPRHSRCNRSRTFLDSSVSTFTHPSFRRFMDPTHSVVGTINRKGSFVLVQESRYSPFTSARSMTVPLSKKKPKTYVSHCGKLEAFCCKRRAFNEATLERETSPRQSQRVSHPETFFCGRSKCATKQA